jgi:outer membrane protein assembly factor BamB
VTRAARGRVIAAVATSLVLAACGGPFADAPRRTLPAPSPLPAPVTTTTAAPPPSTVATTTTAVPETVPPVTGPPSTPAPTAPPTTLPDPALATVSALDLGTGTPAWVARPGPGAASPPAVGAERVVVQGGTSCDTPVGTVVGLDRATGTPVWSVPASVGALGGAFSPLRVQDGVVVALESVVQPAPGTGAGSDEPRATFLGLDAVTGAERWRVSTFSGAWTDGPGLLLVAGFPGLAAIDRATGKTRWTVPSVYGIAPVADAASVYRLVNLPVTVPGTLDVELRAAAVANGSERWRTPVGQADQLLPLGLADGVVLVSAVAGGSGFLAAYDAARGTQQWRYTPPPGSLPGPVRFAAAGGGRVYVVEGDRLVALDSRSGKRRWALDAAALGTPGERWDVAAGPGEAFVLVLDTVVAIDGPSGKERWRAPVRKATTATVADATVYVSSVGRLAGACG